MSDEELSVIEERIISKEEHEERCREFYGFTDPGAEGHVIHNRDTGEVRVVNYGREVWSRIINIPTKGRTHDTIIKAFVAVGFKTEGFRRGFLREFFSHIDMPTKPCSPSKCGCTSKMKQSYKEETCCCDEDDQCDCGGCVWKSVRENYDCWDVLGMLPDAWLVVPEHQLLIVVEVDFTHHPDPDRFIDLWWWLDSESWSLCEMHVDRHGSVCSPSDLAGRYFNAIYDDVTGDKKTQPPNPTAPQTAESAVDHNITEAPPGHFMWRGKVRPL